MEGQDAELVLEPYEVAYSDLVLSSSLEPSSSTKMEWQRLESISRGIMEALSPTGPGLLSVKHVPEASSLRRKLLPLARKLALLDPEDRKRILKEHKLGTDVPMKDPKRNVSSFAMQLRYAQGAEHSQSTDMSDLKSVDIEMNNLNVDTKRECEDKEFNHLGIVFKELGFLMMEIGLALARICDRAIGGHELEQSLMESCSAKGRLIHYHSINESHVMEKGGKRVGSKQGITNIRKVHEPSLSKGREASVTPWKNASGENREAKLSESGSSLWQQWHYDYGIFTVLTAPMFLSPPISPEVNSANVYSTSHVQECPYPCGHTYLRILDPNKSDVFMVKTSANSFIIQVGESADVLSRGKLHSTLHCVCRPVKADNMSRETFVLFLQPAWSKTLSLSDYPLDRLSNSYLDLPSDKAEAAVESRKKVTEEIRKAVPPLMSRLKDEMTFAEFSRETTKQYYGGNGLQSSR